MSNYEGDNIYNINKIYVVNLLNQLMHSMNFCKCDICLDDICALTLAKLPPKYATNPLDKSSLLAKLDEKHIKHLMISIIKQVQETPHH